MATIKKKTAERETRHTICIEVDRKKHMAYKIYAIRAGLKIKELAEKALDEAIKVK